MMITMAKYGSHSILLLFALCIFTFNAKANVRHYQATDVESRWHSKKYDEACHLSHEIPHYGEAIFSFKSDGRVYVAVWSDRPFRQDGQATLISNPPVWKPQGKATVITKARIAKGIMPFTFNHRVAVRLLQELEQGQIPTLQYEEINDGLNEVQVGLSTVNFREAYDAYLKCLVSMKDTGARRAGYGFTRPSKPIEETEGLLALELGVDTIQLLDNGVDAQVFFNSNSSEIGVETERVLDRVAEFITVYGIEGRTVTISGHADADASEAYNLALSKKRAIATRDYLIQKGVSPKQIVMEYFGEARPISQNETAEGKALNRRVRIFVPKG